LGRGEKKVGFRRTKEENRRWKESGRKVKGDGQSDRYSKVSIHPLPPLSNPTSP